MTQFSIGDLASNFMLRRQNHALKSQMARLSSEISAGRVDDTVSHLGGRLASLSAIEHDLSRLGAHRQTVSEAGIQATVVQSALKRVQETAFEVGDALRLVAFNSNPTSRSSLETAAKASLEIFISSLNTQVGGRAVFSGTDVTVQPLPSADVLLDALRTSLAGETTSAGVLTAVDDFFTTSGGSFDSLIYGGSTTSLVPIDLGDGETVGLDIRADTLSLKQAMSTVAVAALVEELSLTLPDPQIDEILRELTGRSLSEQDTLTRLRADLGFAEERIEIRSADLGSREASMTLARNELLAVDAYDKVTEFEAVQIQLETLYSLTARSSRLNLVNYLS